MINKVLDITSALADIPSGSRIMVSGFGGAGIPFQLLEALATLPIDHLTIISNNAGSGETGLALLLKEKKVKKLICSYPRMADAGVFETLYRANEIELELTPQGNLAERIRAQGAGIGGFFTPTAYGTLLAEGKETRQIKGKNYVFESPIEADFSLIKAEKGDRLGNLVYRKAARNFGPLMAMAAKVTIAQIDELVEVGDLDPEHIITPGIFVKRIVPLGQS